MLLLFSLLDVHLFPVFSTNAVHIQLMQILSYVVSTNERPGIESITGHMVYNPAYTLILQMKATIYVPM